MTQDALFGQRPAARNSDPATSHHAAASVRGLRETQRMILSVLATGPATDEEIAERLALAGVHVSPSGARTRRSELVRRGLVVDTGERLLTRSRRQTIVWGLAQGLSIW